MRRFLFGILCGLGLGTAPLALADVPAPTAAAPRVGDPAPAFRLQDQNGQWHALSDRRGQWTVVYFYPKDFTPGCTVQLQTFRDAGADYRAAGVEVWGISLDDVESHASFAKEHQASFPLLADIDREAAKAYGVLESRGEASFARRDTFLIDPEGRIARHYTTVNPKGNPAEVLADLAKLRAEREVKSPSAGKK